MKHMTRSASVRALQDTKCLVIWRLDFDSYIRRFPDVAPRWNWRSPPVSMTDKIPRIDFSCPPVYCALSACQTIRRRIPAFNYQRILADLQWAEYTA